MTFTVAVDASDIEFPCEPGETVLDAAERAGYSLPYSCRKGVCATCEGDLRVAKSPWVRSISLVPAVTSCSARPGPAQMFLFIPGEFGAAIPTRARR